MKKLLIAVAIASCIVYAMSFGAEAAEPSPPSWVDSDEYIVYANDTIYGDRTWEVLGEIREFAENGGLPDELSGDMRDFLRSCATWYATFGMRYEGGLCAMKIAENTGGLVDKVAGYSLTDYFSMPHMRDDDVNRPLTELWCARARILTPRLDDPLFGERSEQTKYRYVGQVVERWGYTEVELYDTEVMGILAAEEREYVHNRITAYLDRIHVTLDGDEVEFTDALPVTIDDRTMIPMRTLAELMGAEVGWNNDERKVTVIRGGETVYMYVDKTTAYVNDEPVEMDVAPVIKDSRTFIPARYISEFLGQKVEWISERREVAVTENKDLFSHSNLEDWIKPMGAVLTVINKGNPTIFPGYRRASGMGIDYSVHSLDGMGVANRQELVEKIRNLTLNGDNETFRFDAALWGSDYTKTVLAKWGDRGIMCWDLFRVANLIQWGYCAGFLSYNEAMAFTEPAVMLLEANFSSWDEAYENYVDGYNWWSGNENIDTHSTERWERYQEIKAQCADEYGNDIFDEHLFRSGVIGAEPIEEEA